MLMHACMLPEARLPWTERDAPAAGQACDLNNSEALLSSFSMQPPQCQQGEPFGQRGVWCSCPGHRMFSTIRASGPGISLHMHACYCHCPLNFSFCNHWSIYTNSIRKKWLCLSEVLLPLPVEASVSPLQGISDGRQEIVERLMTFQFNNIHACYVRTH